MSDSSVIFPHHKPPQFVRSSNACPAATQTWPISSRGPASPPSLKSRRGRTGSVPAKNARSSPSLAARSARPRREVHEETGVVAEIVCPIPGEHHGTTTVNRYWLMRPLDETEAIAWVTPEEARIRIQTTTKSQTKVRRDLAVLKAACAAFARLP